jgi:hypothetical protein
MALKHTGAAEMLVLVQRLWSVVHESRTSHRGRESDLLQPLLYERHMVRPSPFVCPGCVASPLDAGATKPRLGVAPPPPSPSSHAMRTQHWSMRVLFSSPSPGLL